MVVESSQKNKVSPVNPVLGYMKSPLPLTNIGNARSGSWVAMVTGFSMARKA